MKRTNLLVITLTILIGIHCKYGKSNNSDLLGKALLNFQRGLNTRSIGFTLSCDTDTPAVSTKKITGKVKDYSTLSAVHNARISTEPATDTVILTDEAGSFSISGISSTVTELTMGVTATGYDTLSQKLTLSCQNSIVTVLIGKVVLAAAGVNATVMDTSKLDDSNIQ